MKIAFLTSSRADFGIYLPLLKAMRKDPFFDLHIIAFGTHLSSFHGHTVDDILGEGFTIDHRIETVMASDTAESIATSMAREKAACDSGLVSCSQMPRVGAPFEPCCALEMK